MHSESLILFFIVAVVLVGGAITFAHFVAPRSENQQKHEGRNRNGEFSFVISVHLDAV